MSTRTEPMQGKLPDFLRMQAARDNKVVRENLMSQAADELDRYTTRCAELEGALRLLIDHADTCATGLRSGTLSASQASAFLVGERLNVGATTEARAVLAKGAK